MSGVTEPAEPSRDPRHEPAPSGSSASDHSTSDSAASDIVDAEIVEDTPTTAGTNASAGGSNSSDDEEFRQYQQFLEFQKFQEWQRQQGMSGQSGQPGPSTPPSPPPPQVTGSKPWWKRLLRLLRYKWIRRLLYVFILLIVLYALIRSLFGGAGDSAQEYQPGQPPPPNPQPVLQTEPKAAVITVYDWVATKPGSVCELLSDPARDAVAQHHGTSDCASAIRQLNERVGDESTYKNPTFSEDAVEKVHNPKLGGPENVPNDAVVHACEITVEGGPKLGDFGLHREQAGGWVIDGYEPASPCP